MKQAPGFDRLPFDPFWLLQNSLTSSEVDIGRREVFQALVISSVIVVIDESPDGQFKCSRQMVVFEQDAVLQRLMSSLDLSLDLWVIRCATHMIHLSIVEPVCEVSGDVTGPVVAEQPGFVQGGCLVASLGLQSQVQRVRHVPGLHRRTELPGDDVAAVVVQDCREIEPAPADHLQICEVGLPKLVRPRCLVPELVCRRQYHIGRAGDQIVRLQDAIDRSL